MRYLNGHALLGVNRVEHAVGEFQEAVRQTPANPLARYSLGLAYVRSGRPADASTLARIFKEAWQLAYRGIIPHLHLESMIRQRTPEWWREALKPADGTLVLEVAADPVHSF